LKKLFYNLILTLSLTVSVFSQSTTNTIVTNELQITTIITPIGTNIVIPTVIQQQPNTSISTTNTTTAAITNIMVNDGYSTNTSKITGLFLDDFINQLPFYKNKIFNCDAAPLYNLSQHTLGWFGGIDIDTTKGASLGFGVVDFKKQFDILPLSVKTGLNINWPWIGTVNHFVAIGSAYDYSDDKLGTYAAFGAVKTWNLAKDGFFKNWNVSLGVGISDISTYKGIDLNGIFRLHTQF
jgi:hypothetical protein